MNKIKMKKHFGRTSV